MKLIPLTKGAVAMVDDEDFESLTLHSWCLGTGGYAIRTVKFKDSNKWRNRTIRMHRQVAQFKADEVDHIDGNRLNNQKVNLRRCSRLENARNMNMSAKNTTGFKGVSIAKSFKKIMWKAQIQVGTSSPMYLGCFERPEDAAMAYDKAATLIHGEFAKTNRMIGTL